MAQELNAFIEAHQLKPVVDRVFDFSDARAAYAYQASGELFGKVVIANRS
jgi:NADPH:quinone reductase-like Zn-dependent oxidoreductase